MKFSFKMLFIIGGVFWASIARASDPSSANYQMADSYFLAAAGNAQSTSYKTDEGRIDSIATAAATSSNYGVEGRVGIRGTNSLPEIISIAPTSPAKFYTDESASFTVTALNLDGDSLQYQIRQDGSITDGPQASNALTWALSGADLGAHLYQIEVIDPDGTVIQKQAGYAYRKPTK